MSKTIIILVICSFCSWAVSGQTQFTTKDSVYTFWQPENKIVYNDYKWPSPSNDIHAEIALWAVMDLPQNTTVLRPAQMKVYIAPVCSRHYSRANTNDSAKIVIDNILFNILELSARAARVKIAGIPDSVTDAGALSTIFKAIVLEMHENRLRMNRAFNGDVFRDKKEGALLAWQQKLLEELSNTANWATRPVECYRFLQNHPLEPGYSEDLNSNALLLDKYEQVLGRDTWHAEFCQISRYQKQTHNKKHN